MQKLAHGCSFFIHLQESAHIFSPFPNQFQPPKQRQGTEIIYLQISSRSSRDTSLEEKSFKWQPNFSFVHKDLNLCFLFFIVFFFFVSFLLFIFFYPYKSMVPDLKKKRNRPNLKNRPRFSELYCPTTVPTGPCFFPIERFLKLKKPQTERFEVFLVGLYGLVWDSKPCI